jgi:hypothetical protein
MVKSKDFILILGELYRYPQEYYPEGAHYNTAARININGAITKRFFLWLKINFHIVVNKVYTEEKVSPSVRIKKGRGRYEVVTLNEINEVIRNIGDSYFSKEDFEGVDCYMPKLPNTYNFNSLIRGVLTESSYSYDFRVQLKKQFDQNILELKNLLGEEYYEKICEG